MSRMVHVIDDDEAMRDSLSFLLDVRGHDHRTYSDGQTLLDRAGNLEPGCIVTDVRMAGLSGLDLLRRIRTLELPHPVIIITGHDEPDLRSRCMSAGARAYLFKPVGGPALLGTIARVLDSK